MQFSSILLLPFPLARLVTKFSVKNLIIIKEITPRNFVDKIGWKFIRLNLLCWFQLYADNGLSQRTISS